MRVKANGNKIKLYGIIWDGDGEYISEVIEETTAINPVIDVHLNTKGGDVFAGDLIYNALLNSNSDVNMYVDGLAASMGSILMLAGSKIYMSKSSFVMTHAPSGGVRGTAKDMESAANLLRKMEVNFLRKYAAKTGKSQKDLKSLLDGDNWFSADDCLKMGLIDGIVDDVFKQDNINALKSMKVTAELKDNDPFEMSLNDVQEPTNKEKKNEKQISTNNVSMKKELIAAFAFFASAGISESSSDTAMITAMSDHIKELEKQVTDKDVKITALEDAEKEKVKTAIVTAVDAAVKGGKIKADQKETFVGIGENSGINALNAAFDAMGGRKPISAVINPSATATSGKTWDELQKENPRALEGMKENNLDEFKALFKAKFGSEYKD